MKTVLAAIFLAGPLLHVSRQLIALAEATPLEKFAWRPRPGVRSTSEVFMHIAVGREGLNDSQKRSVIPMDPPRAARQ